MSAAATGYAYASGSRPRRLLRVAVAVLAGQLAIGWQNDYLDVALDQRADRREKPVASGEVPVEAVRRAAILAGGLAVGLSALSGARQGGCHLVALASAAAYNLKLKATPASFVPYALSFSLLPVFAGGEDAEGALIPAAVGALGVAAHLINVLPDRDADRELGILGLPQRLSPETDLRLAGALLGCSSLLITAASGRGTPLAALRGASSLALSAGVVASARSGGRRAFRLVLLLALVDVAGLLTSSRRTNRGAAAPGSVLQAKRRRRIRR